MVVVEPTEAGGVRYHLLESVRQYALERLAERNADEMRAARLRHASFYRDLAASAERALLGSNPSAWMSQLSAELGNIRAVIDWSLTTDGDANLGLGLAADLWLFWTRSGRVREGQMHLRRLLEASAEPSPTRAWAVHAAANVAYFAGDLGTAECLVAEALKLAQTTGDARTRSWASMGVGTTALVQQRLDDAEAYLQAGLRLARNQGDDAVVALFLSLNAEIAHRRGDDEAAQQVLVDSLRLARSHASNLVISFALLALGRLARLRGDHAGARAWQAESLALSRVLGDSANISYSLDEFAAVACAEGDDLRAAQLFGSAAAVRAPSGAEPWLQWRDEHEHSVGLTRSHLGPDAFERAWLSGGSLALDEALRLATSEQRPAVSPQLRS